MPEDLMPLQRREARLKTEFASLYVGVPPGVWAPVTQVLDCVTAGRLLAGRQSGEFLQGRRLDDRHFEFRGGEPQSGRHARVTDM
jgi:hypothetical protein